MQQNGALFQTISTQMKSSAIATGDGPNALHFGWFIIIYRIFKILYVWAFCLHGWLCGPLESLASKEASKGVRSPGTGMTDGPDVLCGC